MIAVSDNELVQKCLDGDTAAFGLLVDRYQKPVYNAALRILGDSDEAQDVTQDTFVRAYQHLSGYNAHQKFFSWLYRIAINVSLSTIEHRRREEHLDDDPPSDESSIESKIDRFDRAALVEEALRRLSFDHRTAIILRHYLDLSYADIATVLSLPERTVRSRIYEARQELKRLLIPALS